MTRLRGVSRRGSNRHWNEFSVRTIAVLRVGEPALAFNDNPIGLNGLDFLIRIAGSGEESIVPGDKAFAIKIHDSPGKRELVQVNTQLLQGLDVQIKKLD